MKELTNEQLQTVLVESEAVLASLVDSLGEWPDMQDALRKLMTPDDMLETFAALAVEVPDLMRLTLQAPVAALVNAQTLRGARTELRRRADGN